MTVSMAAAGRRRGQVPRGAGRAPPARRRSQLRRERRGRQPGRGDTAGGRDGGGAAEAAGRDRRWRPLGDPRAHGRARPAVDLITRTSHYESFTMSGTGYNMSAAGCWRPRAMRRTHAVEEDAPPADGPAWIGF